MEGVVKGVFLCNNERTTQLSDRMYQRNVPAQRMNMVYDPRPVQTRYVLMPMLDCKKPTSVTCLRYPKYNTNLPKYLFLYLSLVIMILLN